VRYAKLIVLVLALGALALTGCGSKEVVEDVEEDATDFEGGAPPPLPARGIGGNQGGPRPQAPQLPSQQQGNQPQ
jgi:hypothetical protein